MIFSEKFIKANDNLCNFDNHVPAPYFRKAFLLDFIPEKAEITICGLGFYELYINGRNVTKGPLAPYISNPDDVCYYDNYDITTLLKKGTNSVGILLGNGFRNCFGGVVWDFEKAECRGVPITALCIEASDKENTFVLEADENFKTHSSPITFNDLRMGCRYDARLEIEDWAEVDFDDSEWDNALLCEKPKGLFKLCEAEPIMVTNKLSAIDIKHYKTLPYAYESTKIDALPMENTRRENVYVYDFGVNSAGVTMLKLKNTIAGQVVIIRHGEVEQMEGFSVNTTIFNRKEVVDKYLEYGQTDVYVCKGAEEEIFIPKFKYDGFRYAYVEGLTKEQANEEAVMMLVMNSDLKIKSEFECSDMVLNKLWEIARRSDLSNFYYFPTDCPHREKNGWTGDASVSAEHMLLNYECEKSMKEWLVNIRAAQRENGAIPGIVPTGGWGYEFGSGPAWDSVCVILPYYIYKYTGNKDAIKDNASMIVRYLKYAESRCDENGLVAFGLGDWCDPFIDKNGGITAPLVLTDSLTIYDMAKKAAICFGEINLNDEKEYAKKLAEEMKKAVRSNLVDFETMKAAGDCQTSQAMALEIGIFNDDEIEKAQKALVEIIHRDGDINTCGMLGLRYIYHALSSAGEAELAYKIITSKERSCYGYWVQHGATSMWEHFDDKEKNVGASNNHHFLGDISSWFVQEIAGLKPNPDLSDTMNFEISPYFLENLKYAKVSYSAEEGEISCAWERKNNEIEITVRATENMNVNVVLPKGCVFKDLSNKKTVISGKENKFICRKEEKEF